MSKIEMIEIICVDFVFKILLLLIAVDELKIAIIFCVLPNVKAQGVTYKAPINIGRIVQAICTGCQTRGQKVKFHKKRSVCNTMCITKRVNEFKLKLQKHRIN